MRHSETRRGLAGVTLAAVVAALAVVAGASAARTANPPANAAAPVISGTARQGQTLKADSGSWGGDTPITFSYQWKRCNAAGASCTNLIGASSQTYVLVAGDVGRTVRVNVTAKNSAGAAAALSNPTGVVADFGSAPAATKQPDPSGTAVEGNTITVDNGAWAGTTPITYTFHWQRCTAVNPTCKDISGATGQSYKIAAADVGSKLRAVVTASNAAGKGTVGSNLTDVVQQKGAPPVNKALPIVIGTAALGQTLTTSPGVWVGADEKGYAFQWRRCNAGGSGCAEIPSATTLTYVVGQADVGMTLRSKVTAKNANGTTTATSVAVNVRSSGGGGGSCDKISVGGGKVSVPVTCLTPRPDHLLIDGVKFDPSPFGNPGGAVTIRVHVINEGTNQVVRGALVYVTPLPYNWAKASAELPTGTDGWVSIQIQTAKELPHSGALVMQVRARGTGTSEVDILGGISTRRLVQVTLK